MQMGPIAKLVSWTLTFAASAPLAAVGQSSPPAFFTTPYMVDIRASHAATNDQDALNVTMWGANLNGGFGSWRDPLGSQVQSPRRPDRYTGLGLPTG